MVNDNTPTKQRILITFGKFGALKYISHLDLAKVWERVLRRANLPILYSRGFNTRPRIQLATALPLGITSECELLDVSLRQVIPVEGLVEKLAGVSPPGLRIYHVEEASIHTPALQTLVRSAEYCIQLDETIDSDTLQARVTTLLAAPQLLKAQERHGRKSVMDLRPLIHDLTIDESGRLLAHLATGERGSLRPDDLLEALGLDKQRYSVHRTRLYLDAAR